MRSRRNSGFSLIEMMIVVLVLTIILAGIFSQVILAQQRNAVEQAKLDLFQEAREFMDQLSRDLHQSGYPNRRNFGKDQLGNDPDLSALDAVGLVKVDAGELIFEGDVTGTGQVSTVHYKLDSNGPNCPCLKRSVQPKLAGGGPAGYLAGNPAPDFQVEVQNVTNDVTTTPIFTAYKVGDTLNPVTIPTGGLYWDPMNAPNQALLGSINTIKVNLVVQAKTHDLKTGLTPTASLVSTIKLNNCSLALSGTYMDCN